LKIIN